MDYTKILKRAWQITWRYKALWLFGFLLALFSGGYNGQGVQYTLNRGDRLPPGMIWGIVLFVLVAVFVLIVAAVFLTNLSRAALIGMVREAEETGNTSVGSGWRIGWARFLPLLGIDLVIGIPVMIIAIVLILLALSPLLLALVRGGEPTAISIVLTVFFFLLVIGLFILMAAVLSLLSELAYRQCVFGGKGVFASIRDGWRMGWVNIKQVGVVWLLLLGIDLVVGILTIPLVMIIAALVAAPAAATYAATKEWLPAMLVGLLLAVPAFLLLALPRGVYQVFRSTTWTLAYRAVQTPAQLASDSQ